MALGAPDLASLLVYDYYPGKNQDQAGYPTIFHIRLDFSNLVFYLNPCITDSFLRIKKEKFEDSQLQGVMIFILIFVENCL